MGKYQQLLNDCFWEYNFSPEEIDMIIKSEDFQKNRFLFAKILANSTQLLKDLKLFPKERLLSLLESYIVPRFNHEFLARRKNIVEFHFFRQPLNIEELKWEK